MEHIKVHKMSSVGITDDIELLIRVDRRAGKTLHRQLLEQLRLAILRGQFVPGRRLPSTRVLAHVLGISRNVAMTAYDELFAEGYLERRQGSGTYVSSSLPISQRLTRPTTTGTPRWLRGTVLPGAGYAPLKEGAIAFRLGVPDISLLRRGIWRSVWKDIASQLPPVFLSSPEGDEELRIALADWLRQSRGIVCEPDDILITSSAGQALDLVAQATLTPGALAGVEEPGYPLARRILQTRGASIIAVPVDSEGLRVDALPQGLSAPVLVYVTPSHQFPLGGRLSLDRRMALLAWAQANNSLIIEDDYDSEFRFNAPPLPALVHLGMGGRVVYIGTFSKVLTPTLRIGYVIAPSALRERVGQLKRLSEAHSSWPVQRALLSLITQGHLERHIRRMRHLYAQKRALLSAILSSVAHLAQLRGLEAGLHGYLELCVGLDAGWIVREVSKRGVIVNALDEFYLTTPDRNGLLLGYGSLTLEDIAHGTEILTRVIADARQSHGGIGLRGAGEP
jgi:GntR family transcriptional regulator / MocR family aminotransferase